MGELAGRYRMRRAIGSWTRRSPDATASLESYQELAPRYDATCVRIAAVREAALDLLDAQPGETVVDVACGSGAMLPALVARVGSRGRVVGIEQSPEMLALARRRFAQVEHVPNLLLIADTAETARLPIGVDAFVFSYAHDVLQSRAALCNLLAFGKPGARVVVCGMRFLPWWRAAPVNLWCAWGARKYVSTLRGMRQPWVGLQDHCEEMTFACSFHSGTSFVIAGRLKRK